MAAQIPQKLVQISVIVPVYNCERFIEKCVTSLLSSNIDLSLVEILCVDNSSTDGSLEILKSFEPAIRVLVEPKRGPSSARNAGAHSAAGVFLLFTDSDCMADPDWIAAMVGALQQDHADAVGGRILARPEARVIERFGELVHDHRAAIEVCQPPYMISMNLAIRKDLLLSLGGFDERLLRYEDVDLSYRLLAADKRLVYCDKAVIYHHNRDSLWELMREGYLHGYFGGPFLKNSAHFPLGYKSAQQTQKTDSTRSGQHRARVRAVESFFLWPLFRNAKRFGAVIGRLSSRTIR